MVSPVQPTNIHQIGVDTLDSLFYFFRKKYEEASNSRETKIQVKNHLNGIQGLSELIGHYCDGNLHNSKELIRTSFLKTLQECQSHGKFNININHTKISKNSKIPDNLLDDENTEITISYKDSIIIYLTDNNWYKYREQYKFKNLLFFGTVEVIGNDWLKNCKKVEC